MSVDPETEADVSPVDQIVLHIGTRKTGSTTIQAALMENRTVLSKRGYYLARPPGGPFRNQYTSLIGGSSLWSNTIKSAVSEANRKGGHTVIVTAEDFYYLQPDKAQLLIRTCQGLAKRLTVLLFVRRQDQYVDSSYCQYLAAGVWVGNIQDDFKPFIAAVTKTMDYEQKIAFWGELAGAENLKVIPYAHGNTSRIFFDSIGAANVYDADRSWRNQRHPIDLLRACVHVGEILVRENGVTRHSFSNLNHYIDFRASVRASLAVALSKNDHAMRPYSILPREAYAQLAQRYELENQRILARFGIGDSEGFATFLPDESKPYMDLDFALVAKENLPAIQKVVQDALATRTSAPAQPTE